MRSSNEALVSALRILAQDVESVDGVAGAALQEAADRIEELAFEVEDLRNQNHCNRVAAEARWDKLKKLEAENDALRLSLRVKTSPLSETVTRTTSFF